MGYTENRSFSEKSTVTAAELDAVAIPLPGLVGAPFRARPARCESPASRPEGCSSSGSPQRPLRRQSHLVSGGAPAAVEEFFPGREEDFIRQQADGNNHQHHSDHLVHRIEFPAVMQQVAEAETG